MSPNWWESETDPDPRCFFGTEAGQVWTLPEWQYLRRKSIYPLGFNPTIERKDVWTRDMIYAQLEEDLFAGPMIVDGEIQRRRWRRRVRLHLACWEHLHPYAFPQYGQGIYAIYDQEDQEGELIYIGKGKSVVDRAPDHLLSNMGYRAVRMKPFREDEVRCFEDSLIRKYQPRWNTRANPIYADEARA